MSQCPFPLDVKLWAPMGALGEVPKVQSVRPSQAHRQDVALLYLACCTSSAGLDHSRCLKGTQKFLDRPKIEGVDEVQQCTQGWVGVSLQEFVDRLPRDPDLVGDATGARKPLLLHPTAKDPTDSSCCRFARAITRERTSKICRLYHGSSRVMSYNVVVQSRVLARATSQPS